MFTSAGDLYRTGFIFIDSDATVAEAEELVSELGLPALPVLNPDRTVFGLLTADNLADFRRRPLNNPAAFHAWEICNARQRVARPDTPLDKLLAVVMEESVPLIMVVNDERQLVGVITAEQVLHAGLGQWHDGDTPRMPIDIHPAPRRHV